MLALCLSSELLRAAAQSHKRGIARANLREHQLHALKHGVSWGYNWELDPHFWWGSAGMDFSPMPQRGLLLVVSTFDAFTRRRT